MWQDDFGLAEKNCDRYFTRKWFTLEIASRLIQVVPAITGLSDRLEQQGLVERERSSDDRRVVKVSLTKSGRELLAKIDGTLQELHRSLMGHLTRRELKMVIELMEKIRG